MFVHNTRIIKIFICNELWKKEKVCLQYMYYENICCIELWKQITVCFAIYGLWNVYLQYMNYENIHLKHMNYEKLKYLLSIHELWNICLKYIELWKNETVAMHDLWKYFFAIKLENVCLAIHELWKHEHFAYITWIMKIFVCTYMNSKNMKVFFFCNTWIMKTWTFLLILHELWKYLFAIHEFWKHESVVCNTELWKEEKYHFAIHYDHFCLQNMNYEDM